MTWGLFRAQHVSSQDPTRSKGVLPPCNCLSFCILLSFNERCSPWLSIGMDLVEQVCLLTYPEEGSGGSGTLQYCSITLESS